MVSTIRINPYMTNELAHHYHLVASIFIFLGLLKGFFFMKFLFANRIAPDGTPRSRSAVSHLEQYCLPIPHKEDAKLL